MREIISSVTSRGQVTIPARVRRHLGLNIPGRIAFIPQDDGQVGLRPVELTATSLSGIVPAFPPESPGDLEAIIEEAMEQEAARLRAKMRDQ